MPDKDDIDRLLAMAEAYANSEPMANSSGRKTRISKATAEQMISDSHVNITLPWKMVMRLVDEPLAWAITGLWVPREMLEEPLHDEMEFPLLMSSRHWFDEDKLDEMETAAIAAAVNVAITIMNRSRE